MKTGIIRRIDDLGRVVIPKEFRQRLNIETGDPLEICYSDTGGVTFTPYRESFIDEHRCRCLVLSKEEFVANVKAAFRNSPLMFDSVEFDSTHNPPVDVFVWQTLGSRPILVTQDNLFRTLSQHFRYGKVNSITTDGERLIITFEEGNL